MAEPIRRAALLGGVAGVLVGCGDRLDTAAVTRPPPSTAASLTDAPTVTPVSKRVVARVEKSVVPVVCANPLPSFASAETGFTGTGFKVTRGVVTASHVVAACSAAPTFAFACPDGAMIEFELGRGDACGNVAKNDAPHDLALLTYQSSRARPRPLEAESAHPYVGEPLALIGIPDTQTLIPGFQGYATVTRGIVLAIYGPQEVTLADGRRETLPNAIRVAAPGILPGESGGPAIDAGGRVVGVIEGSGPGIAVLTPVAALTSLY